MQPEARLVETKLLCQNPSCHETLIVGHMPWVTGRLDTICWKCKRISRFSPTNDGIVALLLPAPEPIVATRR